MKKIVVTGANGQLSKCLRDVASNFPQFDNHFVDRAVLNIDDAGSISEFFESNQFDICINTAAYTNVEKAESEQEAAFKTNAEGVKNLAKACSAQGTTLIHISTDYVFDGTKQTPYKEADVVNPINAYGASKLRGEEHIQEICEQFFILRTSWLYSQYGHNFLNSMLRFAAEGRDLTITTEQVGAPTNANDLAEAIYTMIESGKADYGLYHFSNLGRATWYDFAEAIFKCSGQLESVKLAKTAHYSTFAKRPAFSILDTRKFSETFQFELKPWDQSLCDLIENHKK